MTEDAFRFLRAHHAARIRTAEAAVRSIGPGRRIFVGSGAAAPATLLSALVAHGDHLADNEVVHILTLGTAPHVEPAVAGRFRHVALFIGENVRAAVQEGRADFVPIFLSEVPRFFSSPRGRIDVALVQVSPPDKHGMVSLGVSVDVVRAAIDAASLVIAEVNPFMPRTHGDSFLPVDRFDALVPVSYELPERATKEVDAVARAIGRNVATLVDDGATLQLGIGTIPDAVLASLGDRRDLGIHSEMISDGVMRLVETGAITGRRKTLLPGKIVTSFLLGSRALYRWADDNASLELRTSDFTNDPFVIARNDRLVAINGALAVDLTGQVAADTIGGRFFSGVGGQVDFIRGAARSRGGRAVIALPSTARGGASRVQAALEPGAGVVTSRGDVHYVVTEYGVADLWGKSVRERALSLVEIAHPDHRADLIANAKARKYVFSDQEPPRLASAWTQARRFALSDGSSVLLRPVLPSDEQALQDLFYSLSDESSRQRFLGPHRTHPREELRPLVDADGERSIGIVAADPENGALVGYAHASNVGMDRCAEVDFVVRDSFQRRGIGKLLFRAVLEAARARGARTLEAFVLVHNRPMIRLIEGSGLETTSSLEEGVYHLVVSIAGARP